MGGCMKEPACEHQQVFTPRLNPGVDGDDDAIFIVPLSVPSLQRSEVAETPGRVVAISGK